MRSSIAATAYVLTATVALIAQSGKPVPVNKSSDLYYFSNVAKMTVENATLNFVPAGGVLTNPRKEGRQFVRIGLNVTNPGKEAFAFSYTSTYLQAADGTRHGTTSSVNDSNSKDRLEANGVDPQKTVSGALYFEVGAKETLETLTVVYEGHKGLMNQDSFIRLAP